MEQAGARLLNFNRRPNAATGLNILTINPTVVATVQQPIAINTNPTSVIAAHAVGSIGRSLTQRIGCDESDSYGLQEEGCQEEDPEAIIDSPNNIEYFSDDSVYDNTCQLIPKQEHPLLRASRLTKRIRKDKRINQQQRKALKARRNIITFRIRQKRT